VRNATLLCRQIVLNLPTSPSFEPTGQSNLKPESGYVLKVQQKRGSW
jgi:hypothetical protein